MRSGQPKILHLLGGRPLVRYPLALVRDLPTRRGGFVFETEVLVAAARRGIAVREVAVGTAPRKRWVIARARARRAPAYVRR